jgi:hypothetical protein
MRAFVWCSSLALGLGIMMGFPGVVRSQGQIGTAEGLKKDFTDTGNRRSKLTTGDEQPGKADAKVAKAAADYYLYRLTHVTENPLVLQIEFSKAIDATLEKRKDKTNRPYIDNYFGPALVTSMKEVLSRDIKNNQATVISGAVMLQTMAKLRTDSVNAYLIELVKGGSTTHDAVRLYALKALKESLPITMQQGEFVLDLIDKGQNDKRLGDARMVDALSAFIEQPVKVAGLTAEEFAAVRYLRREAIIALANAGSPAVLAVPKKLGKKDAPDGAVAPTLLKVLAGDVQPPPSLQEKIEAAIGLCLMKHPNMPEYDPSVAAYLIGKTVVDFMDDYNKDLANIAAVGAGRKLPMIAYRTEAKRLSDGVNEFAKNANNKSATELKNLAQPILLSMTPNNPMRPYPPIDNAKVNELRQNVQQSRPKTGAVFKTLSKAPAITLP